MKIISRHKKRKPETGIGFAESDKTGQLAKNRAMLFSFIQPPVHFPTLRALKGSNLSEFGRFCEQNDF